MSEPETPTTPDPKPHDPEPILETGVVRPAPGQGVQPLNQNEFEAVMLKLRRGKSISPDAAVRLGMSCEMLVEELGQQAEYIKGLQAEKAIAQVLVIRSGELTITKKELQEIPAGALLRIKPSGPDALHVQAIQKSPTTGIEVPIRATRIVHPG